MAYHLLIGTFDYIIPIWNWSELDNAVISVYSIITLFLYGIGAFYIWFFFNPFVFDYIIPIWNWSCVMFSRVVVMKLLHYSYMELELDLVFLICLHSIITLFLYGIGAFNPVTTFCKHSYYYIIPIWNWSNINVTDIATMLNNYIIPIWNWSPPRIFLYYFEIIWLHYSYMELELYFLFLNVTITQTITLFLYGIGAILYLLFLLWVGFHYIIPIWNWSCLNVNWCTILKRITLFLYGIGARVLMLHLIPL